MRKGENGTSHDISVDGLDIFLVNEHLRGLDHARGSVQGTILRDLS